MKETFKQLFGFKRAAKANAGYLLSLLVSILLALLVGAGIMLASGHDPLQGYAALLTGALSGKRAIGDTLAKSATLCLLGLATAVAAQGGIFNCGGEGQLYFGAIASALAGEYLSGLSPVAGIPLCLLIAMLAGALWAYIPGLLKVKLKVNEVITTIMLNSVATFFCAYLGNGPLKTAERGIASGTAKIDAAFAFSKVIKLSNLTSSIFISAFTALLIWYLMKRTTIGYEMKLTGENERFAGYAGINSGRLALLGMLLSGAICGMVGMFEVFGIHKRYTDSVSNGFFWDGMLVAMIMRYQPMGIILMSFFFGILKIGGTGMEKVGIPSETITIVQSVIIFFMAAEGGISASLKARRVQRAARLRAGAAKGGCDHV